MPQLFPRRVNTIVMVSIVLLVVLMAGLIGLMVALDRSSWVTRVGATRQQPIPFSHELHVSGNGIDCRYCHLSVETAAFAGIPSTRTCMNCHTQIATSSQALEPLRASATSGTPLQWTRVHDLPDFAYFDHSIHVKKGVGCSTCHGRIDQMPVVQQEASLQMDWCLDCHRHPERYVRPRSEVFLMNYRVPTNQLELGRRLVDAYKIQRLSDCTTCHR
jgi:cytochrome c7-like protein